MIYTLATAGHIDHGKSTLVKALTGINPDRLPEEQQREMTIDLGFAWFDLDDETEVGIVDVPGHERFIRNMISGVGGIDYVLFIVAADDGWMPQSQEHLEILDFLGHKHGAVVITKVDLVREEWIELVEEDIRGKIEGSFLEGAPIFKFSSRGSRGLEEILDHLKGVLPGLPERYNPQKPRLYIDRVFSLTGIGTVVTGTMRDGSFKIGDEVRIISSGRTARIKSIQTFKQQREVSFQGVRTALSLTGVSKEEITRGDCLAVPDQWQGTRNVALRVSLSDLNHIPLSHNRKVTVLIGTTEIESSARVFKEDDFSKSDSGVCIFEFENRIMARLGDSLILRYPTPDILVGGGVVTDVDLSRFIRRDKGMRKFYFERRLDSVRELIVSELRKYKTREAGRLLEASNLHDDDINGAAKDLIESGEVEKYGNYLITAEYKISLFDKIIDYLKKFHADHPSRRGVSKSEITSKLKLEQAVIDFAVKQLQIEGRINISNNLLSMSEHETSLKPQQQKIRQDILDQLAVPDLMTPTRKEIEKNMHQIREVLNYLIQSGEVIELSDGILYRSEDFDEIKHTVTDLIRKNGSVEVKDIKNAFGLTRKYTIPILEYLDRQGFTRREGDKRVLNE
ncbi:MAG TPA: selenocysteine-specific translation elongation factor [candidate division Zixibacteria bacterium]|nr:selenocysteine-specific translation elongation factor [candidate division Zixibacteria bacterium]HEQ99520.1 selenocysteine-specific translation elongation factor [candidate division Zixibacteria bacterium]